jgi:hypothetical protein
MENPTPKAKRLRRFQPRFEVVTQVVVEEEAKERDNYLFLSHTDLSEKVRVRHNKCEQNWAFLQKNLEGLNERERLAIQAMFFRDVWFLLETYNAHLGGTLSPVETPPLPIPSRRQSVEFTEFLFADVE